MERTAAEARSQFHSLQTRYDFIAEGRSAFGSYLGEFEASGRNANDAMCFVWYLEAEQDAAEKP